MLSKGKVKIILKTNKNIPPVVLSKIENTGLKGKELFNLKKTVIMQIDSGIKEPKMLLKLVDDYMKLVNSIHKHGKELI